MLLTLFSPAIVSPEKVSLWRRWNKFGPIKTYWMGGDYRREGRPVKRPQRVRVEFGANISLGLAATAGFEPLLERLATRFIYYGV
jgi:hypothetical protein